jgi:hypothetical protein
LATLAIQIWNFQGGILRMRVHYLLLTCGQDEPPRYHGNLPFALAFSLTTLLQERNCQ